jgi:hypothetical protein
MTVLAFLTLFQTTTFANEKAKQTGPIQHLKILQYGGEYEEIKGMGMNEIWYDPVSGSYREDVMIFTNPVPNSEMFDGSYIYSRMYRAHGKEVKLKLDENGEIKGTVKQVNSTDKMYKTDLIEFYKAKYQEEIKMNTWEPIGSGEFHGKAVNKVQMIVGTPFGVYRGETGGERIIAYLDAQTGLPLKEEIYVDTEAKEPMIIRIFLFDTTNNAKVFEDYGDVPLEEVKS